MTTTADLPAPRNPRASKASKVQKTLTQEMSALLAKTFVPDLRQRTRQSAV